MAEDMTSVSGWKKGFKALGSKSLTLGSKSLALTKNVTKKTVQVTTFGMIGGEEKGEHADSDDASAASTASSASKEKKPTKPLTARDFFDGTALVTPKACTREYCQRLARVGARWCGAMVAHAGQAGARVADVAGRRLFSCSLLTWLTRRGGGTGMCDAVQVKLQLNNLIALLEEDEGWTGGEGMAAVQGEAAEDWALSPQMLRIYESIRTGTDEVPPCPHSGPRAAAGTVPRSRAVSAGALVAGTASCRACADVSPHALPAGGRSGAAAAAAVAGRYHSGGADGSGRGGAGDEAGHQGLSLSLSLSLSVCFWTCIASACAPVWFPV